MSKTEAQKPNDVLPDDDALNAFAAAAFAPRKRAAAAPKADEATPPPAEKTVTQEEPEPSKAEESPAVVVPAPAGESEKPTPDPAPRAQPRAQVAVREARTQTTATQRVMPETEVPEAPLWRRTRAQGETVSEKTRAQVEIPDLGSSGARPVQCTVMVAVTTRDRLANYQLAKKMETGREPTNAMVVRRSFLHARKQGLFGKLLHDLYNRQAPADEEDFDDDGLLGEVAGRRTERGRMKDNVQQSFRPSMQELAAYDAFCEAYRFPNRSEFLDAVLDEFLPPLPSPGRRRG